MKVKLSQKQWTEMGKKAGWFNSKMKPNQDKYTPEELAKVQELVSDAAYEDPGEEGEGAFLSGVKGRDDNISRRRGVKVTFSDGDTIKTPINGTIQEIRDYYMPDGDVGPDQDFDINNPNKVRHVVKVDFLY